MDYRCRKCGAVSNIFTDTKKETLQAVVAEGTAKEATIFTDENRSYLWLENEDESRTRTEHLGAKPGEQTDDRRGYRNGSYERTLTTRIGQLKLEVPRDRDGTFRTELFERYERSEIGV